MKKNPTEITKQADLLEKIKPRVRRMTGFGDDNHEAIDAQVVVLRENLSEDQIEERWRDGGDEDGDHIIENALYARQWMDGEFEGDSLVAEWLPLVQKGE